MFAIIKTGGKQYIVSPGDKIKVEKLETPDGEEVVFDSVLLFSDKETQVGAPYIKDYIVKGKILKQGNGEKIIVYKYKAKKRYHKKQGHRQLFTEVEIISIGKKAAKKTKSAASAKKKVSATAKLSSAAKKKSSKKEIASKRE